MSCQHEHSQQAEDTGDDDRIRALHEEDAAGDVSGAGSSSNVKSFTCCLVRGSDTRGKTHWLKSPLSSLPQARLTQA
jgi:hypothetical protein